MNPWIPSLQWSQTPYRTDFLTKPSSFYVEEWIIIGIASVIISMTWRGHCLHGWQQRINGPSDTPVPVLKPGCHQGSDENKRLLSPWRRELPAWQAPVCCGQPWSPSILVRKAYVFAFTNSHYDWEVRRKIINTGILLLPHGSKLQGTRKLMNFIEV